MENEINQYVSELIRNSKFKKQEYFKFYDNDYEFPFLTGRLESSTAVLLLKKALYDRKLRAMTHSLLWFCDANTVNLDLLNIIGLFSRRTRYSYYSSLVHCSLTFTQCLYINEREYISECFGELVAMICENDIFTENDMRMLIERSKGTKDCIKCSIDYAESCYGCIPKIEEARKYL